MLPIALDLNRHGVVEASAGTGKTFTLEQLVLELLTTHQVPLEQILLVTYTEKATGELKTRLRDALVKHGQANPAVRAALDRFDQASICTIHGFCQRVLQEYAFENGQDFRPRLVHDRDLLEGCLRELQRRHWRQQFGARLPFILELAGYAEPRGGERWEQKIRHIVSSYRPACGHRLRPQPRSDWLQGLPPLEEALRQTWAELRRRVLSLTGPGEAHARHPWLIGYSQLSFRTDWREKRQNNLLVPLLHWLTDPETQTAPLSTFRRLLQRGAELASFEHGGFELLTNNGLPTEARNELPHLCPGLKEVVATVEPLRRQYQQLALEQQLLVHTVQQLQEHLATLKRERGWQSFDDLLQRVDQALDPQHHPRAAILRTALRQRYRYAIVDEFQDTDPLQWRIFRRLFVEHSDAQRLIVVGDPKQAIFGFRGADLNAFLLAKQELCAEHQASYHNLPTNWRSCPELLTALNQLFEQGQWFADTGITYRSVEAAPHDKRPNVLTTDRTGRAALTLVQLGETQTLAEARRLHARFIAAEIARLLGHPQPALEFTQKKVRQHLRADHVCILVGKRSEARPLLEALAEARIPYTFYKQPGLWQTEEAVHLEYLLRALLTPREPQAVRQALLTRFFRIRPEELAAGAEQSIPPAVHELFASWRRLAQQRHWPELFRSLLEDTGVWLADLDAPDGERRRANYQLITQKLLQTACMHDLDLLALLEVFADLRSRPGDDETALQPIETEKPKVCILTIHAAKGLEFPIVFLAGGFTQEPASDWFTYHEGPDQALVFDLERSPQGQRRHQHERDAEQRRLLYVALTRAMFKLYVPFLSPERKYHAAGPLATILAPALERSKLATLAAPCVGIVRPQLSTHRRLGETATEAASVAIRQGPAECFEAVRPLFPELDPQLRQRRLVVRSFSSLHRESTWTAREAPIYIGHRPRADDDAADALSEEALLRGPIFGEIMHAVLEKIDFASVLQAADAAALLHPGTSSRELFDEQLQQYLAELPPRDDLQETEEHCRQLMARLVWNGLHTPLQALGGCLGSVPATDRLHELEFDFSEQEGPPVSADGREGFLTGIIDLVVRHHGQYFLIDWKTNVLNAYTPADLHRNMKDCDYVRQYRLYGLALVRWLKRVRGHAFHFARDFGGVYYLYLRGLNGRDESSGVVFLRPTLNELCLDRVLRD